MHQLRLLGPADLRAADGSPIPSILTQPKRLAFLAYLAAARPEGFQRRDTLIGVFWPELDHERARAAVRQTLYTIRKAAGAPVLVTRGDEEVGVDAGVLWCDVAEFRRLRTTDPAGAMDLYRGELLQGLFVREAPEFERWLETERATLRSEAAQTAWRLAESAMASDTDQAIRWARRASALDPFDEGAVRRVMRMFADSGRSASALHLYAELESLLARELETAPSAETQQLAAALRSAPEPHATRGSAVPPSHETETALHATSEGSGAAFDVSHAPAGFRGARWATAVVAVLLITLSGLVLYRKGTSQNGPEVVAVGAVQSFGGARTDSTTAAVRALLATNLARIEGIEVISDARVLELARGDLSPAGLAGAARRAGASRIVEGSLFAEQHGMMRLQLQWTELRSGRTRIAAEVRESESLALVNAATTPLARSLGREAPTLPLQHVTTRSLAAYRLFEAGLRAYYSERVPDAQSLFRQALAEDSLFALAWWYYAVTVPFPINGDARARAFRHADMAGDRERLFIRANYFAEYDDPRALATADTLSVRYPSEPSGLFLAGFTRMWAGDFPGAIAKFRAVLHLDSASIGEERASMCWACRALWEINSAYALADSGPAALRHGESWTRAHPKMRGAWAALSAGYDMTGRYDEAIAANQRAAAFAPYDSMNQGAAEILIRAGDFTRADSVLLERIGSDNAEQRANGYWMYTVSLRNQKRYAEAIRAAREFRRLSEKLEPGILDALPEAVVLLDAGRARDALILFDSMAQHGSRRYSVSRDARSCATHLGRVADARALLRDTAGLNAMLPELEGCARATSFGPAQRRPSYVRGLIAEGRGDIEGAIGHYRAAMFSPTNGDTRVNYRLGTLLLRVGRNAEAGEIAEAALRGSVGGSGYMVTHRALHELARDAWDAHGNAKRAATHRAWLRRLDRTIAAP